MDIMKAAYDGMAIAMAKVAKKAGTSFNGHDDPCAACPAKNKEYDMSVEEHPCFECDPSEFDEEFEDDAVCQCCKSQAALFDSKYCDFCIQIVD
jgi:hypothetical protein